MTTSTITILHPGEMGASVARAAREVGNTRLFLSGRYAGDVAALFAGSMLAVQVLDGPDDAASALKMCFAAWTKSSTALLADIRALATSLDVDDALLAQWDIAQPGLAARSESAACSNAFKAWRWIAEMDEIANTFAAQGLPDGFHRAAGQIYQRLAGFKHDRDPDLARIIAALRTTRD